MAQKGFFFEGSKLASTHLLGDPLVVAHPEEGNNGGTTRTNERNWLVGYFGLKIRCMHWNLLAQKGICLWGRKYDRPKIDTALRIR